MPFRSRHSVADLLNPSSLAIGGAVIWAIVSLLEARLQSHAFGDAAPEMLLISSGIRFLLLLVIGWQAALAVGAMAGFMLVFSGGIPAALLLALALTGWGLLPLGAMKAALAFAGIGRRLSGLRLRHLVSLALADTLAIAALKALQQLMVMGNVDLAPAITAIGNSLGILATLGAVYIFLKLARGSGGRGASFRS